MDSSTFSSDFSRSNFSNSPAQRSTSLRGSNSRSRVNSPLTTVTSLHNITTAVSSEATILRSNSNTENNSNNTQNKEMTSLSREEQFYQQATEALIGIQNNIHQVDPLIRELLKRLQQHDTLSEQSFKLQNRNSRGSISGEIDQEYPQGTIFECELCFKKFDQNLPFKKHCKDHFRKNGDLHICPKCFKGFARKDAMRRHKGTKTCDRNRKKLIDDNGGAMPAIPPTERP